MISPEIAIRDRVRVVSLLPDVLDQETAADRVSQLVKDKNGGFVCVSNVHMVMEAFDSPVFADKVNSADLIVADGMPVVWMQRLQHKPMAKQIRGIDLMVALLRHAEINKFSVGFYGGETSVLDAVVDRADRGFPGLEIVYRYSPPFRTLYTSEDESITEEIRNAAPDILFVGLGCPKQENWMADHYGQLTSVLIGVGAAFDFYAGTVRESPQWVSRLGLEWLFRLKQEPKRLWRRYLIQNPRFVRLAGLQLLKAKKSGE